MSVIRSLATTYFTKPAPFVVDIAIDKSITIKRKLQTTRRMAVSVAFLVTDGIVTTSYLCFHDFYLLLALI